jgi:hypothetical protein
LKRVFFFEKERNRKKAFNNKSDIPRQFFHILIIIIRREEEHTGSRGVLIEGIHEIQSITKTEYEGFYGTPFTFQKVYLKKILGAVFEKTQ